MDTRNYWLLLRKNRALIFLLILTFTFGSYIYTKKQTPIFTANAQIYVAIPNTIFDRASNQIAQLQAGGAFTQARVFSYAQVINSPAIMSKVIEELNLRVDPYSLGSQVSADAPPNSVLINLHVSNPDPILAAKIANSVANNFKVLVKTLEVVATDSATGNSGAVAIELVKPATPPSYQSSPKLSVNLSVGFILGMLLSVTIAIVRKFFENRVKNESHLCDVALIGTIGFDRNVNRHPLITDTNEFSKRNESFRILRSNFVNKTSAESKKIQVVALMSSLAKEGKTSTVINLGVSLAQAGLKVLAIETDLRKPTFSQYSKHDLDQNPGSNIIRVLENFSPQRNPNTGLQKDGPYRIIEGLDIIASPKNVSNPTEILANGSLKALINAGKRQYDYILIDTSPALLVADAIVVSRYIDAAMLVVSAGRTPCDVYAALVNLLNGANIEIIGAVLNKVPRDRLGEYGYSIAANKTDSYSSYGYGYYIPSSQYSNRTSRIKRIRLGNLGRIGIPSFLTQTEKMRGALHFDAFSRSAGKGLSKNMRNSHVQSSDLDSSQLTEFDLQIAKYMNSLIEISPAKKSPAKKY